MEINVGQIIAAMINFTILYFILRRFLFKPVNNAIESRENEIKSLYDETEKNKQQAIVMKNEIEERLNDSKREGKVIIEEYKNNAEKIYSEIVKEAKEEAEIIVERARKEAKREKEKAESEVKHQVVDISLLLAEKALEKELNEKQHRELIEEFISKVGI